MMSRKFCSLAVLGAIVISANASECGKSYTDPTGTITSPGSPSPHISGPDCRNESYGGWLCRNKPSCVSHCSWNISTDYYKAITLSFSAFNIPSENSCCPSHLEIYDGVAANISNRLGSYCGNQIPKPVTSTSSYLHLKLTTSSTTSGVYFQGNWKTECASGILQGPSGTLSSPGFPAPLQEDVTCMWTIFVDPGHVIEFTFETLVVGNLVGIDRPPCIGNLGKTVIRLYDSMTIDEKKLRKSYCTPYFQQERITSYGNYLVITFSDSGGGKRSTPHGFSASYKSKVSTDSDDVEKQEGYFWYGESADDQKFAKDKRQTGCIPFSAIINADEDVYIPVGDVEQFCLQVHKDGKIMFSPDINNRNGVYGYVCAYCTIIDFSGGDADIFYSSVIDCKNKDPLDPSIVTKDENCQKASQAVANYTASTTFKARLICVVTWDDVKGRTNDGQATFQAVIISDMSTTYALIYYIENKMNWTGSNNQIKIGFGAYYNKSFEEQDIVFSGTKEAQQLDLYKGNFGRKGTWIFKIGELLPKPEKDCDDWYRRNLLKNKTMQQGFQRLPSCPCTFTSLTNLRASEDWILFSAPQSKTDHDCYYLAKSSSRLLIPYNKLCCYSKRSDQTIGVSWTADEGIPGAGFAFAFNPQYLSLAADHFKEDIEAYHTCCVKSVRLCDKFYQLRPIGTCNRQPNYRFAWLCCDPRITTLDEKEYVFNGWGEYTMVTLTTTDVAFTLQGRTEPAQTDNGRPANATVFTAFGAEENGIRAFVGLDPVNREYLIVYAKEIDYTLQFRSNPNLLVDEDDFTLSRRNNSVLITYRSGINLMATPRLTSLALSLSLPLTLQGKTRGLLGNFNGIKEDDFILPNGTVLKSDLTEREIFENFGKTWEVTKDNSVMRYGPREGPADYAHQEFTPDFLDEQQRDVIQAAEVCEADSLACIYDFLATGSATIARDSGQFMAEAVQTNTVVKNAGPLLVRLPSALNVTVGYSVTFSIQGEDPDKGDTLSFHVVNDGNPMVQLNHTTGVGTFSPGSILQPVNLRFYAVDSHGAQSPIRAIPVVICSGCNRHGVCNFSTYVYTENTSYNFRLAACVCQPAFDGLHCELDKNWCAINPCKRQQVCLTPEQQRNSQDNYTCGPCPTGFVDLIGSPDCVDVDECENNSMNKCNMQCVNTEGSYECICDPGYRLDGDGHTCMDINECQERSHNCEHICSNTVGGFTCLCQDGYSLDHNGASCTPGELTLSHCSSANCSQDCKTATQQSSIANIPQCFCRFGYDLDLQDNKTCRDHDECKDGICTQKCYNYDGGFSCYCHPGFQLSSDKRSCIPCPPLNYGLNCELTCTCNGRFSSCHPVKGCQCDAGWTGRVCQEDLDECAENKTICSSDQICYNIRGSYTCRCLDGYTKNAQDICQDIDECAQGSALNTCGAREECVNQPGGFYCTCISGYQKTIGACADIDECVAGTHVCEQDCVNVLGTYYCDCKYGYRLNTDRVTCSKVTDVCAEKKGLHCAHGCTLSDDDDRAVCFCKNGYQLSTDQQSCEDINECTVGTSGCSHACANTDGGYFCSCPLGMKLDTNRKTCLVCPTGTYGKDCAFICACGIGSERCDVIRGCVCMPGWQGERCADDVNECNTELVQQECQEKKAKCENYRGGYRCKCEGGYEKDGNGVCQDINECLLNLCDQDCENSVGGYRCLCYKGFTFNSTTGRCQDKNECEFPVTNRCTQRCINAPGSFVCTCDKKGYALNSDGVSCYAVTNCTRSDCPVKNGGCSKQENGTEECFCNSGYTILANNTCQLEDVRWCEVAKCDQGCKETPDGQSFICSCRTGYLLLEDRTSCKECPPSMYGKDCLEACTCSATNTMSCNSSTGACRCKAGWEGANCSVDVNECTATLRVVCPLNSHCVNTIGSYLCPCDEGYRRDASGRCVLSDSHPCNCGPNANSCDTQTGTCLCKAGFEGLTCSDDINECSGSPGVTCPSNSHCVNSQGSYLCSCDKGYQTDASGNCVQFKRQKVRFTIKDISVNANDLADVKSMTYTIWAQATSKALTEKMQGVPGFKSVDVISLRVGSLIVESDVVFDDVTYPTAVQTLAVVLVGLVGQSVTLQDQTGFLLIDLDDIQVGSNMTSCHVYKAIKPCPEDLECIIDRQLPQCRPKSSSPDQTTLIVVLCVVIPVVVIIVIVIIVCCVCKQKKCSKAKPDSYVDCSGAQTADKMNFESSVPPASPAAMVPDNYAPLQYQLVHPGMEHKLPVSSTEHPYAKLQAGLGSAARPQHQMEISSLVANPTQQESILSYFPRPDSRTEHTYDTINHSEELAMTQNRPTSAISINTWTDGLTFETENLGN